MEEDSMQNSFIQDVYGTLWGLTVEDAQIPGVENLFEEGMPCAVNYGKMLAAYERLLRRLGCAGTEDPDVEIIMNTLMDITDGLSYKMYEYGAQFGIK